MVGEDAQAARQLDVLRGKTDQTYNQLMRLVQRFGMAEIDVAQIRSMIQAP